MSTLGQSLTPVRLGLRDFLRAESRTGGWAPWSVTSICGSAIRQCPRPLLPAARSATSPWALKSATVGVFIPWESTDAVLWTDEKLRQCSPVLENHYPIQQSPSRIWQIWETFETCLLSHRRLSPSQRNTSQRPQRPCSGEHKQRLTVGPRGGQTLSEKALWESSDSGICSRNDCLLYFW